MRHVRSIIMSSRTALLSVLAASLALPVALGACMLPMTQPASSGTGPGPSSSGSPGESEAPPAFSAPREERASAPAAPTTASVTIRSACSKTAKVFYGEKPGFSSGTQSSISSNSVQSKTFRVGDLMWVTDDSGKPLDSVQIDANTRQIEITSSCSGLSSR
jgi:hypothetical protein